MTELRVAYLGPQASYTHQAAIKSFNQHSENHRLEPRTTIEDVFTAVHDGEVDRGVVPFENSTNGSVVFTLDLFADLEKKLSDIVVVDEVYLPVQHCLLGRKAIDTAGQDSVPTPSLQQDAKMTSALVSNGKTPAQSSHPPRSQLSHIAKLYSHPQAWGQCKTFLNTQLKGVERQDASSTSRAAELAAADNFGTSAAISSRLAAELTGLDILADGIEDHKGNSTRFFVLQRVTNTHSSTHSSSSQAQATDESGSKYKTLVSFTVAHTSPGSLADALAVFKKHRLNLTSINSRPSGLGQWMYIFFVELWGLKLEEGKGGVVNEALAELKALGVAYRWLGSWRSAES